MVALNVYEGFKGENRLIGPKSDLSDVNTSIILSEYS